MNNTHNWTDIFLFLIWIGLIAIQLKMDKIITLIK